MEDRNNVEFEGTVLSSSTAKQDKREEWMDKLHKASDMRKPHTSKHYKMARLMERKITMHVGPTNSGKCSFLFVGHFYLYHSAGKTHHALLQLMKSKSGVYCGPLRMLAAEVYEKLNKEGVPTDLVSNLNFYFFPFPL